MMEIPILLLSGLLVIVLTIIRKALRKTVTCGGTVKDPTQALSILAGVELRHNHRGGIKALLESRAVPNQRLVEAFDINNAFTTFNANCHADFRAKVSGKLLLDHQRWEFLAALIANLGRYRCDTALEEETPLRLVPLVQTVVLEVVIGHFFRTTAPAPGRDIKQLENVAALINKLWLDSKHPAKMRSAAVDNDRKQLHDLVSAACGIKPAPVPTSAENPLNVILPAYETLWRVVLRGFLELQAGRGSDRTAMAAILRDFLAAPAPENFDEKKTAGTAVSAASVIQEILRLYPPTKRIHRVIPGHQQNERASVRIDVEALHRDETFWGPDPQAFRPARWNDHYSPPAGVYLPFGGGVFKCPAAKEFGPKMIALLVGVLLDVFRDWDVVGLAEGEIEDMPLPNGRCDFEGVQLYFLGRQERS